MPRIPGIPDPLDERQQALYDEIASGPRGRVAGPLGLWLYSPDYCERAQKLGEYLRFASVFDKAHSELIILIVAAHYRCDYEWYVHAPIALKNGVPERIIESIRTGLYPLELDEDQDQIYTFTKELLASNAVSPDVFETFVGRFGQPAVVEITAIMGYYAMGAFLLNAVEYNPPDGGSAFDR